MKVVVTGGTGLIGGALTRALLADGHEVTVLTRSPAPRVPPGAAWAPWPAGEALGEGAAAGGGGWLAALEGSDAVVHLAGEPLATRRWDAAQKRAIRESRVGSTRRLVEALAAVPRSPRVLVAASAVGYYGDRGDTVLSEAEAPGTDFLAQVCAAWEEAALRAEPLGVRVVRLRTSLVLDHDAGGLPRILAPFRLGAGGPLGSGRQWVPWIHRDDAVALARFALEEEGCSGPMNCTSPAPVTNRDFSRAVGRTLGRPSWATVPAVALRLAWGEMADALLLAGQRAVPARAQALGFRFLHPDLDEALRDILARG